LVSILFQKGPSRVTSESSGGVPELEVLAVASL
jgi:hypothetical protein